MGVDQSWEKLFAYLGELQMGNQEYYRVVHARLPECVKEFVLYDDKPRLDSGGFVHYTSWERFLNILDDDKREEPLFRMYNYEFANDPEEGNTKPLEWKQCEDKARELSQNFDPHWNGERSRKRSIYGCSFSTNGDGVEDNLMFWRLYGGDGNGCSFKLGGVPKRIYKVRYIEDGESVNNSTEYGRATERLCHLLESTETVIANAPDPYRGQVCRSLINAIDEVLDGYLHLVKSRAYAYEQEWRMIRVNPDERDVRYAIGGDQVVRRYVQGQKMDSLLTSGSKITLGPKVANVEAAKKYVEDWLRRHEMHETQVRTSSKKYR